VQRGGGSSAAMASWHPTVHIAESIPSSSDAVATVLANSPAFRRASASSRESWPCCRGARVTYARRGDRKMPRDALAVCGVERTPAWCGAPHELRQRHTAASRLLRNHRSSGAAGIYHLKSRSRTWHESMMVQSAAPSARTARVPRGSGRRSRRASGWRQAHARERPGRRAPRAAELSARCTPRLRRQWHWISSTITVTGAREHRRPDSDRAGYTVTKGW